MTSGDKIVANEYCSPCFGDCSECTAVDCVWRIKYTTRVKSAFVSIR